MILGAVRHLYWRIICKQDDRVRCASPIFMLIAYYLGFTNRKRKYVEEKMTATLKTDIDRHRPKASSNSSQPPDPPHFSFSTTFNNSFLNLAKSKCLCTKKQRR
jgi:hypothetical protein